MNIIAHKYIFLSFSAFLTLGSVVVISFLGLNLGIDFRGGSLLEAEFQTARPEVSAVREGLSSLNLGNV